tara:strand:- start:776 stop:1030 length:255 start_codon:yes stop_codon:yes gene_type:complete
MWEEAGAWFWMHVVAATFIVIGDYNGTLEPALNKFEERLGIRTVLPDDSTENDPPYYMPPIEDEPIDSTWILPEYVPKDTTRND